MLFSNISGMQSTSTAQGRMKGSATKIPVPCPDTIKMYNQGMGGVDLVDQRTPALFILIVNFKLDFTYVFFFDLMDLACVNAFIVYNIMHQNDLTLLDHKTIISTHLIGRYASRSRAPPEQKAGSKRKH